MLALAREVGMLRLRLGPAAALEIADEGPEVGGRTSARSSASSSSDRDELALAVFTSEGCHVCQALEPAVDVAAPRARSGRRGLRGGRPTRDVWEALGDPGRPYAIALERDGTVGAKGTFNNLAQLESILATAERRRAERAGGARRLGV